MQQWILEHSGALGIIWAGGLVWLLASAQRMGLGGRLLAGGVLGGLLVGLVAGLAGVGLGPGPAVQWAAAAALIFTRRPATTGHSLGSWLSLVPLVLVSWQGLGAMMAAVLIAGSGALDRGRARRWVLLGSLLAFSAATLIDDRSLQIWAGLRRWLGLGLDAASMGVHLLEQVARAAGWGALLVWMGR